MSDQITYHSYGASHPWYYVLGGPVLSPRTILEMTRGSQYRGYKREYIQKADNRAEPMRSEELRQLRSASLLELKRDISIYRRCVRELLAFRETECEELDCNDVHVSMGLKVSHLTNDFAHLIWLDELLSVQADLFG
ncbi:hypothetical protein LPB140_10405 [Sphingorhabdus lutea]|uniref:Uncharacterized protein n=1 Tax=Sphingorhabdus lutea TaxID=1913578 RepID=A0A1L3JDC5_9SPHN|nr:hypothetical protein [Sphingorhabdus lutea]APG63128.1 hypothetical protein LPB140_10405 [Sphingorhabdus lutea]